MALSAALMKLLRQKALFFGLFCVLAVAYGLGGLTGLDNLLTSSQFRLARSDASQKLVLIEIDAHSLAALNSWPWPRSIHAELIERLKEAGVRDIALNVDFSARSSSQEDGQLARALANSPGQVILPVFRQNSSRVGLEERIILVGPIARLRDNAVPGSVNVSADSDGVIRRHATVENWNGITIASMAALLAGSSDGIEKIFHVDYGIRAETIPVYSYADIYLGRTDLTPLDGKSVLIGASAAELGARFTIPAYGTVPGTLVHALAYESMVQNRMLQRFPMVAVAAIGFALGLVFLTIFGIGKWRRGALTLVAGIALLFFSALAVQAWSTTLVDSGFWMLCLLAAFLAAMARGIDQQAYRLFVQGMAVQHRRNMMDAVLDNNFHGIVITDSKGRIQFFNDAAENLLTLRRQEVLLKSIESILPGADILELSNNLSRGSEHGTAAAPPAPELEFVRSDGERIPLEVVTSESAVEISKSPFERRVEARVIRVYTFRDIRHRKFLEQAQEKALEEALSAGRSKAEFLAVMSHELRTPLNAIIGFSDILRNQLFGPISNPQYLEYANDIYRSGAGLLTLVTDILSVSRVEAGKFDVENSIIDVSDVISASLRLIRGSKDHLTANLVSDFAEDLPRLQADERLLMQMMINIVSNAVKFTEDRGEIRIRAYVDEYGRMVIETSDEGIGMSKEDIPRVLLPFQQADGSLERKFEGSGLGLYLVSKFIDLHDGELEIDSAPGVGTTVKLLFPSSRVLSEDWGGC